MNYREFLERLGSDRYSPEADEIYQKAVADGELAAPLARHRIPELFGELACEVFAAAQFIEADEVWLAYTNLLRLCYPVLDSSKYPLLPPEEGNIPRNFAPVLSFVSHVDEAIRMMNERGIDAEQQKKVNSAYKKALLAHREKFGFYAMQPMLFYWARHYLKPDIFTLGSLQFEITTMPAGESVFRSKVTGDITALFDAAEAGDAYTGGLRLRSGADAGRLTLPKTHFEPLVRAGEDILSVHIPAKAKIDRPTCEESFRLAAEFFAHHFPERNPRAFYCRSWLMDPALADLLGESTNIVTFQRMFRRYPVKSSGAEVFAFVHPQPFESYSELPENTTLMRGLKKRCLAGDPIYVYAGIRLLENGGNR